jgi:hypothetical protein
VTLLAEGSSFADRYVVIRRIAAGGMGAVYEVLHTETDRRRALKVMHPHVVQSPELRDRFKREAKVAAAIDCEFIVEVFDAGIDEGTGMPFLVMELLRGEELGRRIARVGPLPREEAVTYLWQTALALERTHQANIVHRDLKPENLFATSRGDGTARIKILDFGIAKVVAETASLSGGTRSLGTPLYMAPEQFRAEPVRPETDTFSLGIVAFSLLVGKPYWEPETHGETNVIAFAMIASRGPREAACVRAERIGVTLPPAFDAWFAKATAPDPGARYDSARTMIRELAEILEVDPQVAISGPAVPLDVNPHAATVLATPVEAGARTAEPVTRGAEHPRGASPVFWVLSTIGVMAILGGLAAAAWFAIGPRKDAVQVASAPPLPPLPPSPAPPPSTAPPPVATAAHSHEPTASASAPVRPAQPKPPAVEWRKRGSACIHDSTEKYCVPCCNDGDRLGPFPDCECLFDGRKWDREHGLQR